MRGPAKGGRIAARIFRASLAPFGGAGTRSIPPSIILSEYPESNRGCLHPMQVGYHYPILRSLNEWRDVLPVYYSPPSHGFGGQARSSLYLNFAYAFTVAGFARRFKQRVHARTRLPSGSRVFWRFGYFLLQFVGL